jgi:Fe-S-cluster-containing hydrogenase component 2
MIRYTFHGCEKEDYWDESVQNNDGWENGLKRIVIRESICSGCRACELACVVQKEGYFGTASARIRVHKNDSDGLDQPHVCQLCEDFPCVVSCPTEALFWDENAGHVILIPEDCIHCTICIDVCPFDAIWMHPETMLPLLCDFCSGDPACIKRCTTGAIMFSDEMVEFYDERST